MAQLLAQEEKEKTTALKGKASSSEYTLCTVHTCMHKYKLNHTFYEECFVFIIFCNLKQ